MWKHLSVILFAVSSGMLFNSLHGSHAYSIYGGTPKVYSLATHATTNSFMFNKHNSFAYNKPSSQYTLPQYIAKVLKYTRPYEYHENIIADSSPQSPNSPSPSLTALPGNIQVRQEDGNSLSLQKPRDILGFTGNVDDIFNRPPTIHRVSQSIPVGPTRVTSEINVPQTHQVPLITTVKDLPQFDPPQPSLKLRVKETHDVTLPRTTEVPIFLEKPTLEDEPTPIEISNKGQDVLELPPVQVPAYKQESLPEDHGISESPTTPTTTTSAFPNHPSTHADNEDQDTNSGISKDTSQAPQQTTHSPQTTQYIQTAQPPQETTPQPPPQAPLQTLPDVSQLDDLKLPPPPEYIITRKPVDHNEHFQAGTPGMERRQGFSDPIQQSQQFSQFPPGPQQAGNPYQPALTFPNRFRLPQTQPQNQFNPQSPYSPFNTPQSQTGPANNRFTIPSQQGTLTLPPPPAFNYPSNSFSQGQGPPSGPEPENGYNPYHEYEQYPEPPYESEFANEPPLEDDNFDNRQRSGHFNSQPPDFNQRTLLQASTNELLDVAQRKPVPPECAYNTISYGPNGEDCVQSKKR